MLASVGSADNAILLRYVRIRDRFIADCSDRFVVVHIAPFIVDAAMDLLGKHGRTTHLFSLDALQIATLTVISEKDITFVCADKRLTTLVKAIGFPVLEV